MAIIASVVARIKSAPLEWLGGAERVDQCFASAGHCWRNSLLTPARTLGLFMLQILHGNTSIIHLRLVSEIDCAPGSYCEARSRLPVAAVAKVVEDLSCNTIKSSESDSRWLSRHRLVMTDATTADSPDHPELQNLWPQPSAQKPGCGFPAIKLLMLMDFATGMILHLTAMCLKVHEMSQLAGPHVMLQAGDVLLGDRAFCSFAHLWMLGKMSVHGVFRMHQRQNVDFTPDRPHRKKSKGKKDRHRNGTPTSRYVKKLGVMDQIVEWIKPRNRPVWMSPEQYAQLPTVMLVRELKYQIAARGMRTREVTIATTLLDPTRYPKREIASLYGLRWQMETNFRHLKTTMKMEHLKCQTVDGILRELLVYTLVYNLVRAVMVRAAHRQNITDANRISFIDALRWLINQMQTAAKSELPELVINPMRPGRSHPRVKKRRMKEYDLMTKPRSEYMQNVQQTSFVA